MRIGWAVKYRGQQAQAVMSGKPESGQKTISREARLPGGEPRVSWGWRRKWGPAVCS